MARILVVEDEKDVRELCTLLLTLLGHEVESVSSGERALLSLRVRRYDIVMTDLGLPGMDGWAVARAVKQRAPATAVGLISGWELPPHGKHLAAAGVDFVLPKPFNLDLAETAIAKVLRS
ncbi:MAG: response regulator [Ardenticatenaceae bacterium]|nr:response regulator [Ardenticatenaceae bacterium]